MTISYDGGLTCSIGVSSLDRSIPWYRDVLGFELLYRLEQIAWCELKTAVDKGYVMLGLKREGQNLEEVFRELTTGPAASPNNTKAAA